MKKIIRENDSYKGPEFTSFNEFKKFPAEDFKSSELVKQAMEAYKSEEVKKISFVGAMKEKAKKKNQTSDKLKNSETSSAATKSSAITSSVTGAATTIIVGAVGAAVVLGPAIGIPITQSLYGTFEVTNYRVEKVYDDESNLVNDIYIYYDKDKISSDFDLKIKDPINEETKYYETNILEGYIKIEGLPDKTYDFEVCFFKKGSSKISGTEKYTINTVGTVPYIEEVYDNQLLVTYNSDSNFTSNVYFASGVKGLENIETIKEYTIQDEFQNELDYEISLIDNGFIEILNINEKRYTLYEKIYSKEGVGEYLIYETTTDLIDTEVKGVEIEASQSSANLYVGGQVVSEELEVIIEYNDLNIREIKRVKYDPNVAEYKVEFSEVSTDVDIDVRYEMNNYSTFETEIPFEFEGSQSKMIRDSKNFKFDLVSEVELKKVEFCSENIYVFNNYVTVYLDGYLLANEYAGVELTSSDGTVIQSIGYRTDLTKPFTFDGVPLGEELTISYFTYYESSSNPDYDPNGTQDTPFDAAYSTVTSINYSDVTFENNEELELLVENNLVSARFFDASEYYLTISENNKMNAYADLEFVNDSEYDVYIGVKLGDLYDSNVYEIIDTYDGKLEILDFYEPNVSGGVIPIYSMFVDIGNVSYQITSETRTDYTFLSINDNEASLGQFYPTDQGNGIYKFEFPEKIISDIIATVTIDNNSDSEVTIPLSEITENEGSSFTIDVSEYTYTNYIAFHFSMKIELNAYLANSTFIESMNIQGSTEVNATAYAII